VSGAAHQARLWYLQRISAMALALGVLVHLAVIQYAVRGGLTGAEILGRTRGNWAFGLFYAVFVLACAVHVPIGFAKVAQEWLGWSGRAADALAIAFGVLIAVMGLRAVYAVVLA
jgi:fumarate reductase subunit C